MLHTSWGPLEPFDISMPQMLQDNGIHTHLASDHYHYWEDGGATYHCRYTTWEAFRGQEGDPYHGDLHVPKLPPLVGKTTGKLFLQDQINRKYVHNEEDYSLVQTVNAGIRFLETNYDRNNWFLQVEAFDPHEPYVVPDEYKNLYPDDYEGPDFEWPRYEPSSGYSIAEQKRLRRNYMALVTMCDRHLGRILDTFDRLNLWEDTMLIVNTDHGFLLGEHQWFGKNIMPVYQEIANIPLFIYDPRLKLHGERRTALVQTIDLAPTLLEYFGLPIPKEMLGKPLFETIKCDKAIREAGLFGRHGEYLCVTDGNYVYMRAPRTQEKENYTVMPSTMFSLEPLKHWEPFSGFSFLRGASVMRFFINSGSSSVGKPDLLFCLQNDPDELHPIHDEAIEATMQKHMLKLMVENEAPEYLYRVLDL